ncbi:MAG TPA: helicase-exonuclease AddAB subunit AddA [Verrucomicrobiae bacterium]|nr:helicase-exonuclease AddAB subunit AddA [Verrucomicrobiae bacterium]
MSLTPAQQKAVAARGNVLVVAGAGTGKTSTLVERCLGCLLDKKNPASLDEILMVTFTDAAAAEMRQRIRARLEQEFAAKKDELRWSEELALFETAHIGTLHSFCLQLVRQHFYELELDPQLTVMPEEEAKLLADETLEEIFQGHYAGTTESAAAVQQLIQSQGRGWDKPIRALVLKLHHYTQTLRDPAGWFNAQLAMFQSAEPAQWQQWLMHGIEDWRNCWLPALRDAAHENKKAAECASILNEMSSHPGQSECADVLEQIRLADGTWPAGKKTAWRKPLEDFFAEAAFFHSLARKEKENPLTQDWSWVRPQMTTLLQLAREFTNKFSEAKRELGVVDFHDLEQHALELLWDRATGQPTATAEHWRKKLRFVFVDEYQDINDAQDAILKALSREDDAANRFLVGDVKQSIYRFRLADPRIFQDYVDTWNGEAGAAIPLVDNFRSREGILSFINSLFGGLMRRAIGGVPYGPEAELRFGDPEHRAALSLAQDASPRVELHLRLKGAGDAGAPEGENESSRAWTEMMNLEEAAKEARMIALRLRELKTSGHQIWDAEEKSFRAVHWGDMAVLLRSPAGKAESYAREFTRVGIPLTIARNGFYESMEVTDLLSLLQLLDNPLQDVPVLAVLHSPLVGMTLDELASIRLIVPKGHCWAALQRFHETRKGQPGWTKADRFLKNFAAWRRLARQVSLSRCLEAVLGETHYGEWLLTQSRGEQRRANVQRLVALAQQFDAFQRQGLFRFLRFIEAQQAAETEPQVAAISGEDTVRLMSIHQSKGLEFPVVVAADLGKPFNLSDLRAEIILDAEYGLCPQVKPPHTGQRYPSLPYWLARQRQKQETLGEEMRLLYVALTRARDTLILAGSVPEKKFHKQSSEPAELTTPALLAARSYLDWISAWNAKASGAPFAAPFGENAWLRWTIYDDLDKRLLDEKLAGESGTEPNESNATISEREWNQLHERLTWKYPHMPATQEPAKTSVTALRRRLAEEMEAAQKFEISNWKFTDSKRTLRGKLSAGEIGNAHHSFLQHVSLEQAGTVAGLQAEAKRLELEGALSAEEMGALDFTALAAFWQSEIGKKIRQNARFVRRELEFTARFAPGELKAQTAHVPELFDDEFVVVQGVADLAVILPEEIWLVDFKTDRMKPDELDQKRKLYEPQLRLYAQALNRIYNRPVSKMCLHFLAVKESLEIKAS